MENFKPLVLVLQDMLKFLEKILNMKKEELEKIVIEQPNLKNLPNTELVDFMELLSSDFELTKDNIIKSTLYLDKIEELYNNVLKVYQDRNGR
jgi:hypothetical protein